MIPAMLTGERAKAITWVLSTVATTASIMIAWSSLGLPTIVFSNELNRVEERIDVMERFNRDTRVVLLDQQWWRNKARLDDLEGAADASSRELRRRLQQEQADLERLIQDLRGQN